MIGASVIFGWWIIYLLEKKKCSFRVARGICKFRQLQTVQSVCAFSKPKTGRLRANCSSCCWLRWRGHHSQCLSQTFPTPTAVVTFTLLPSLNSSSDCFLAQICNLFVLIIKYKPKGIVLLKKIYIYLIHQTFHYCTIDKVTQMAWSDGRNRCQGCGKKVVANSQGQRGEDNVYQQL